MTLMARGIAARAAIASLASNPAPIFFGEGENRAWYPLSAHVQLFNI